MDLATSRWHNQLLAHTPFERAGGAVGWLGAVQAQDYHASLWAVGLRTRDATEATIEAAIAARTIVRTWPMRGTLHLVPAADVRWLLARLAPRAVARAARRMAQLGLDERVVTRAGEAFGRALEGGRGLTRDEMRAVLAGAGIDPSGQRTYHLLWRCAQDGLICLGARRGKQQTFVLLDEWVPGGTTLQGDDALAELATRYFAARGPATVRDFAWWSGLPAADARRALETAAERFVGHELEGRTYWSAAGPPVSGVDDSGAAGPPRARLLPAFDEYLVGYTDRSAVLEPIYAAHVNAGGGMLGPTVALDGRIAGVWRRTLARDAVSVEVRMFGRLDPAGIGAVEAAAAEYARFLGLPLALSLAAP